jgi:amidase
MDDIIYASASELARAIRGGEVSSVEVVEAHLERIGEVNPKLNAVVHLTADAARARAAMPHGTTFDEGNQLFFSYTMTYNMTGWPGAVVRAGTSAEELPLGAQLVARPWREDVALASALEVERALGGWQRPTL